MLKIPVTEHHLKYYFLVFAGMCVVILTALAFEHIGGYTPCKLCLQQREPWYLGIPVMALATLAAVMKWPSWLSRGLISAAGIIMLYSLWLGTQHAGVEWGWWEGPGDCGAVEGGIAGDTGDFLLQLQQTLPPSCTEAPLRILGLSFAGWNALASLGLAVLALRTAIAK